MIEDYQLILDVFSNKIKLGKLQDQDNIKIHDLFEIVDPIGDIQEKDIIMDKNVFEKNIYYNDAVSSEKVLQDYYLYLSTQETKRNIEMLMNSMRIFQKYKYHEYLV